MRIVTTNTYNVASGSKIFGSLSTSTDSLGKVTRYFYDSTKGLLLSIINPDGNGTVYSYDDAGRVTSVLPAKYVSSTYSTVSGSANVAYTYDTTDRLSKIQTASTTYNLTYDVFGNTDTIKVGSTQIVDYTYNNYNGKLDTITYGNGFTESYEYDALDRISEIWYNGVKRYEYSYDVNGNLYKIVDIPEDTVTIYRYDDKNRVTRAIEFDASSFDVNSEIWQTYDDQSRLSLVIYTLPYTVSSSESELTYSYFFSYNGNGTLNKLSLSTWLSNVNGN